MKNSTIWVKLLTGLTTLTTLCAALLVSPLCLSQFHQPVVPESLRNHD